ncbi:hypothetical protein TRFO_31052 [Tritrichomonas foetus]|uniref:Chromo domain-containing protein n=1 Tax=Tritrichomonas foetus TaxID=1144522 RepID=A0A1J4JS57_9EUKA|nr:hypothetical protein TRFO_31052 [Tritrichomonas foetus]|eukprot:OHT01975.1 hypothetical protein TRFO_31052 [Tritrichomonas foetus]
MESANEEEDGIYEVEAILGHQKYKNRIFYKIKWKGYPIDECTWEEKSNLFCPDILNEYLAQKSKRRSKRKRANSKSKKSYPKSLIKSGNSLSTLEKIQSYEEMLFPSKQPEYEATFNPPPPLPPPFTFNTQIRPNNFISQGGTTNTQEKEAANSDHYLSIHEANNSQSEKVK